MEALVVLSAATAIASGPVPFTWRCQVASVGPPPLATSETGSSAHKPPPPSKKDMYQFSDGFNRASVNGTGTWTSLVEVSAKNLTAAKAQYPNSYNSASFPGLVLHFSVSPAVNLTTIECEWSTVAATMAPAPTVDAGHGEWTGTSTARLVGGGTMGVIVSTNADANPVPVSSFADFNKVFILPLPTHRPSHTIKHLQHFCC